MWWGGFLLCGLLLILVAIPFYAFPKTLQVRVKFEIHVLVKMMMLFFVAMPFGLLDRYQCFIETYCFTSHFSPEEKQCFVKTLVSIYLWFHVVPQPIIITDNFI
jgi:hypothetical protein